VYRIWSFISNAQFLKQVVRVLQYVDLTDICSDPYWACTKEMLKIVTTWHKIIEVKNCNLQIYVALRGSYQQFFGLNLILLF
jgi:hypothetical protein